MCWIYNALSLYICDIYNAKGVLGSCCVNYPGITEGELNLLCSYYRVIISNFFCLDGCRNSATDTGQGECPIFPVYI